MSEILVVVPEGWAKQDRNIILDMSGFDEGALTTMQGGNVNELNERLVASGFFLDDRRIVDVLVLDGQIFFRIE